MKRGTTYNVPLNKVQAQAGRDAVAKVIYDRLFDWLVSRVNRALQKSSGGLCIGVLDIYGFEVFDKNGFEQLCINYVNEKLQQIFIEFVLKQEQEQYIREGIAWTPIDFFNNKIVCDLIEEVSKPPGVFSIMNDVCRAVHSQSDSADKALGDRLQSCQSNPHFLSRGNKAFTVKHYAGDVTYELNGMVEKNKDTFITDHLQVIQMTTNSFLLSLFPDEVSEDKRQPRTGSQRIIESCNELVKKLSESTPHYIRCIKPNDHKQSDSYDAPRVTHQIKYLGLVDNIKVKRAGFAYKTIFKKFMDRYYLISPSTAYAAKKIWKGNDKDGCVAVLKDQPIAPTEWQIGKTKVFIRSPESLFLLEDLRINYWNNMVNRMKFAFRTWKGFKGVCVDRIKHAWKAWKKCREECTLVIQKSYRDFKQVLPPDLRTNNEQNLYRRKKRRRLSMISVRRFYGDYLDVKANSLLMNALGSGSQEKVIFSYKGKVVHHPGLFKKKKLSPRTVIITENAVYFVLYTKVKGEIVTKLDCSLPINAITGCTFSPLGDDFIIFHTEEGDVVLECPFKSEVLAWITTKNQSIQANLKFEEKVKYIVYKKKKNEKVTFIESSQPEHVEGLYKNGKFYTPPGLPPDSRPTELSKKQGETILSNRPLPSPGTKGPTPIKNTPPSNVSRPLPSTTPPKTTPPVSSPPPTANTGRSLPPNPTTANNSNKPKCRALYNYNAQENDELTIRKGDVITVIKEHPDWWEGELNGTVGVFPANYVEKI